MKASIRAALNNPVQAKALEWAKLITVTGVSQIAIQASGIVSGILVIRLLPVEEYALYTIVNTMLGAMTLLSDSGIHSGVVAQGGKVWQDRAKLGTIIATGLDLRKKFAIVTLLVTIPVLIYLLRHHNASWLMSGITIAALIPSFYMGLSGTLLQIGPKLKQDIIPLQKNQLKLNLARFILLVSTLFVFPWAFVAILASGLPQIWGNTNLREISKKYVDLTQQVDKEVRKEILKVVKYILPGAIYYCISGQVSIWLISIVGSTAGVAQLGALGRITIVISVINIVVNTLISPRFARLPEKKILLIKTYAYLHLAFVVICLFVNYIVYMFAPEILWILGEKYDHLDKELTLMVLNSCINLIWGLSFNLCSARGWILNPAVSIISSLSIMAICAMTMNLQTVEGVLHFNFAVAIMQFIVYTGYGLVRIMRISESELAPTA